MAQAHLEKRSFRVGIDVGGTFTHAVALDSQTLDIVGRSKVPTTHQAEEGVAKGIIKALNELLQASKISPGDVAFIAHSTTQATNALLEGDVAPVGIIGMGRGIDAWFARAGTNIGQLQLAPGKFVQVHFHFIDTSQELDEQQVRSAIGALKERGARAIAVSEAFGVDDAVREERVAAIATEMGLPATCGSEVSKLYGLKVRTRTAVINACMMPKMIETANMTEASVHASGIKAPVMIMRSDGGVMDIEAMRRRPILTMLSGPAAGVAAAMMYLNISDGLFVEVGGTSTDISAICNGRALVKSAEIGGHRLYMKTLDVRTIGVAGGSMMRVANNQITDVGPRSAHIAGLGYVSFHAPTEHPVFTSIQPQPDDPADYLAIAEPSGANRVIEPSPAIPPANADKDIKPSPAIPSANANKDTKPSLTITPTCAANYLKLVPEGDCAYGNTDAVNLAFAELAKYLKSDPKAMAESILRSAYTKCLPVVSAFLKEYQLKNQTWSLVGGGGGAAAIVPFMAKELGMEFKLAKNADMVSAIGVALALVRETVERNIIAPKPEDILRVRQEAYESVRRMGADPNSIEMHVEVDAKANVVRATAYGATGLSKAQTIGPALTDSERTELAAHSMKVPKEAVRALARTSSLEVFGCQAFEKRFLGLLRSKVQPLRTMDEKGVIRLQTSNGVVESATVAEIEKTILRLTEEHSSYGDAGRIVPNITVLAASKIVDLSGIAEPSQITALARVELSLLPAETAAVVIAGLP